jgi:demethylmenaquinone methyltransferase/2-methoxy-6-polyprenyl-1,4-benzoquinol methylase
MIDHRHNRFFNWLSPFYDGLIRRPEAARHRALLNLPQGALLLDLGGGTGRVSQHLAAPEITVVVCDVNRSMLRQTRRKQGLWPLQADAAALPFADGSLDGILVVDALHHFMEPTRIVDEMLRVLNRDGRLLIEEQDICQPLIKLVNMAEKVVGLHSHFLTLRQIKDLFDPTLFRIHVDTGRFFTFRVLISRR